MTSEAKFVISGEDKTQAAFNSAVNNVRNLSSALLQARTVALGIFGGEVVQQMSAGVKAIVEARIEQEKFTKAMAQAVGTEKVRAEVEFLRGTVDKLGLQFNSTAQEYAKFAASSRGTALEGEQTRQIFDGISKASAAMGLSSEQSAGALNALQQMISKGKVSAEELRGQLGERLPGAFQIAARSMGVTTQELDKMLQSGELLASDFLPRFARQLQTEFAAGAEAAANSTQGSVNGIINSWNDLKRNLGEGAIGQIAAAQLRDLNKSLREFNEDAELAKQAGYDLRFLFARGLAPFIDPNISKLMAEEGRKAKAIAEQYGEQERARLLARAPGPPPPARVQAEVRASDAQIYERSRAEFDKLVDRYKSPVDKMADEIKKAREAGLKAVELGAASASEVQALERAIRVRNDTGGRKVESEAARARKRQAAEAERETAQVEDIRMRAIGFDPDFNQDAMRLFKLYDAGRISLENYSREYLDLVQAKTAGGKAMKEAADRQAQANQRAIEEDNRVIESARQSAVAYGERAAQLKFENDAAGLTAAAVERLRIARREEYLTHLSAADVSSEYIKQVKLEIEERQKLATELERRSEYERASDEQKKLREDATRSAEHTQQAISNAIFRAFQDGDFTAKKFAKLLQATFAEVVLRPQLEIASKAGSKAIEGILGAVVAGIRGYATTTAPVVSGGWTSAEGGLDYGGLTSKSMSAPMPVMPSVVGASAAPNVSVANTYYIDSRTDQGAIVAIVEQGRQKTMSDIARQLQSGGALQRMT